MLNFFLELNMKIFLMPILARELSLRGLYFKSDLLRKLRFANVNSQCSYKFGRKMKGIDVNGVNCRPMQNINQHSEIKPTPEFNNPVSLISDKF